jgi:hypothetical protein
MTTFLTAAILPVVWVIIQKYIAHPLNGAAKKHLPEWISKELTKQRFE